MTFAIIDCGFFPCCALDIDNAAIVRFDKIAALIEQSDFGIHDISRIELDYRCGLPRFNMPLELGMFIGAARFGGATHRRKNILILDSEQYRYQVLMSDIAGHDIRAHGACPRQLIIHVRNWLNSSSKRQPMAGGRSIHRRFMKFNSELPAIRKTLMLDSDDLTYHDYHACALAWIERQTGTLHSAA